MHANGRGSLRGWGLVAVACLLVSSCTEQDSPTAWDEPDAATGIADVADGELAEGAQGLELAGPSIAPAGWRVLGEFEGEFDPISGLAHLEMVEPDERKTASRSIPGMDQTLRSNEESEAVDGRVRFLQDASGNGTTVGDCRNFWEDVWSGGDTTSPFWSGSLRPPARFSLTISPVTSGRTVSAPTSASSTTSAARLARSGSSSTA